MVKELNEADIYHPTPLIKNEYPNLIRPDGNLKRYIPAREYLRTIFPTDMGGALFENQSKNLFMMGSRGYGKDLHRDTLLWYEDCEKPIHQVRVGDRIYNHLGDLVTVTNVFKFTDQLQYEVTLSDGRKIKTGLGHKWYVLERKSNGKYVETVKELRDLVGDYKQGKGGDAKYFIPYIKPLKYSVKNLPIDPYTLGVLLGDGGLTQRVTLTTEDPEILDYIKLPDNCEVRKNSGKYQYSIVGTCRVGRHIVNPISKELKLMGLLGKKTADKFIPDKYFYGSYKQRLELLQGLMDTGGYVSKKGQIEFSSSTKELAYGVKRLCETLGIRCQIKKRKTIARDNYRLYLITSLPVFKLRRKLERININSSNREKTAIVDIKPTKIEESYCISVNGPDNLFVAGPCIPTHNSYSVGVGIVLHEWLFDGKHVYDIANKTASEIVVGAGDAKYSSETLSKTKTALEQLPGAVKIGEKAFPAPFSYAYKGS